ncbi:hypothetical protein [Dermacoccus sp. Ellin185]|uniref:hypothetical protein n=1 Tax=Dermacoccus sp. Ellin185 TaxID=188626 RepID=UPI0020C7CD6D|nr:hypothetical protein [Dermacoccus sp. Ellin185]
MKVGLEGLSPGQVVLARLASGAAVLLAMCAVRRQPLPRRRAGAICSSSVSSCALCPSSCSRGPSGTSPRASRASTTPRHRS